MNDDMPWVNLTQEEVEELRSKKQELTQYGKEKIRELMNHEEMLEIAAEREAINKKALEELGIDYENFGQKPWDESMLEEAERREKENKVLEIAKQAMDNYKPEPPKPLSEMTREERVEAGIQEIWWIVQGGQDGKEYADSIAFVIQVLDSLR